MSGLDPTAFPRVAREMRGRGVRYAVIGAVLLLVCGAGWYATNSFEVNLLTNGARTSGYVKKVERKSIVVRFFARADVHETRVEVGSSHDYQLGDSVTVIYDPDDPTGRIRTTAEMNINPGFILSGVGMILGLAIGVMGLVVVVRWSRRLRITEWRLGRAEADDGFPWVGLKVEFDDGATEHYLVSRPYADRKPSFPVWGAFRVWVGGAHTVAFTNDGLCLVAVRPHRRPSRGNAGVVEPEPPRRRRAARRGRHGRLRSRRRK